MYNGIHGAKIYLVRFLSCVSLHAMWLGSVALMMYRNQDFLDTEDFGGILAYRPLFLTQTSPRFSQKVLSRCQFSSYQPARPKSAN